MNETDLALRAVSPSEEDSEAPASEFSATNVAILPAQTAIPTFKSQTPITPLVCDERAIARLLEKLLMTGGLSINEASRLLGVGPNSIRQYIRGRRKKPSLWWFVRLAELCGARVWIEFDEKPRSRVS